jgi:hypothetical protein
MMHDSSVDMRAFVDAIGIKLNTIPAKWERKRGPLPMAKQAAAWTTVFNRVHARFCQGDYRHTDQELGQIAELAQWLVNLHREMNNQPPTTLTVHADAMVVKKKIIS